MTRPALVGAGGNLVVAVMDRLRALPGLAGRVDLHLAEILPNGRASIPTDVLARTAVLLEEVAPERGTTTLSDAERLALPARCTTITLPRLEFTSLWPLMADDPSARRLPDGQAERLPRLFGDRVAMRIARAEPDPAARRAAYDATGLANIVDLRLGHTLEARYLVGREAGCDVRVAAFVLSQFRAQRLFFTSQHPTGALLHYVMAQLYAMPALGALIAPPHDPQVADALLDQVPHDLFADTQAPIHPHVAAHFGLAWWRPDLAYAWRGHALNFSDWIDWYLADAAEPAAQAAIHPPVSRQVLQIGPGLAALGDGAPDALQPGTWGSPVLLHPAAEIVRVAPFFATAIDPVIARHGASLLSEASTRYRVGPAIVARLSGAVVLDDDGLVLHQGAVVADSAPPNLSSVAANLPAIGQSLEGRFFVGHGHDWRCDPKLMVGTVPRLVAFAQLRRRDAALRLLLPQAADTPALRELLGLLDIVPDEVTWFAANAAIACTELMLATRFDPAAFPPVARQAALTLAGMVPMAPAGPARVYLFASGANGQVTNAEDVTACLGRLGFAVIDADALDLAARIALMRHTTCLVAAQGPALANMVFCPAGATVLELVGPANPQSLYWSMASCAGQRYGYIVGAGTGPEPGWNEDFTVPLDMLQAAVAATNAP